jgi:chromate transporter
METNPSPFFETLIYFLRLGCLGFGGPLALIATMQRDLIEKRGWMSPDAFSRAFALIKAMPGPVAFQTSVFLGRHRAGWKGGFAAAIGLNFPPFVMMVLFGIFYQQWRGLSGSSAFLTGMQAAALGVILASLKGLAYSHRLKPVFWILATVAGIITLLTPALEPLVIVGSGLLTTFLFELRNRGKLPPVFSNLKLSIATFPWFGLASFDTAVASLSSTSTTYIDLIWSCFKSGAFVFGSGLAIVPLMEHDFVSRLHWLTHQEFMDALAFGQITPGPVVITATFIGFRALGLPGAAVATIAIFSASFFHMMTWFPRFVDRLSKLIWISAFLTGALGAVVGSIFATAVRLALSLELKWVSMPIIFFTLASAIYLRLPVWALIPLGGIICLLVSFAL